MKKEWESQSPRRPQPFPSCLSGLPPISWGSPTQSLNYVRGLWHLDHTRTGRNGLFVEPGLVGSIGAAQI